MKWEKYNLNKTKCIWKKQIKQKRKYYKINITNFNAERKHALKISFLISFFFNNKKVLWEFTLKKTT